MIKKILFVLLYPWSLLYGWVTGVRNRLFDWGVLPSQSFPVPIISVGNITVGGTGKTPHIEYLIRLLAPEYRVAVLSRGYGRKSRGFRLVDVRTDVAEAGDEPYQMKQKFPDIIVSVDEQRVRGVRFLLSLAVPPQVILLDDAFQHRYIRPGLSIVLADYYRPMFRDVLLPAGRLRESVSGLSRTDVLIVSKTPDDAEEAEKRTILAEYSRRSPAKAFFSGLLYSAPMPLYPDEAMEPENWNETTVLLLTGIARPGPLKVWLEERVRKVISFEYPDHHSYVHSDIDRVVRSFSCAGNQWIVTTEKDAGRLKDILPQTLRPYVFVVPVSVGFDLESGRLFDGLVLAYVRNIMQ